MKTNKILLLAVIVILITSWSCDVTDLDLDPMEYDSPVWITFEEVSQSYLENYGTPEEETIYSSESYNSVNWWWWSQGFMVCFVSSTYDDVYGWKVDHTYSFDPF